MLARSLPTQDAGNAMRSLKPLALLLPCLLSAPAFAGWEVGGGYADEVFSESSVTAHVAYAWPAFERYEQAVTLGFIADRSTRTRDISPDVLVLLHTLRIPWRSFYFGLGAGLVSDKSDVLSSTFQFTQAIGWRFSPNWQLEVRHISNAGIEGRNIGENLLTLSYRFD